MLFIFSPLIIMLDEKLPISRKKIIREYILNNNKYRTHPYRTLRCIGIFPSPFLKS